MQFQTLAVSLFLVVAAADTISDLLAQMPPCGTDCFSTAFAAIGCAVTDFSCQCGKVDVLTENVSPCLLKACSITDVNTISQLSSQICAAVSTSSATAVSSAADSAATTATRASNATFVSPTASTISASTIPSAAAGHIEAVGMGIVALVLAAMTL